MRAVRLIGAVTPLNADAETARLAESFARDEPTMPRWAYARRDARELDRTFAALSNASRAWETPLRQLYCARIEELRLEGAIAASAGMDAFAELAARRFGPASRATDLARAWIESACDDRIDPLIATDGDDPRSLLSHMRAEIGAQRAPFTVKVARNLTSLAATGERTVYVAAGRRTTERAARRIALHEVHGHVLPRVRAESMHPIFALGTARGADDQEGLALFYEQRAGLLDADRKRELARRHRAAALMCGGADFVETTHALVDFGFATHEAVVAASRVFRGSDGKARGLGRECVYIASLLDVAEIIARDASAERVLASGQVAVSALDGLRALFGQSAGKHASAEPPPTTATV
jgi:hypothetical protein